jgi:hypothetical protein
MIFSPFSFLNTSIVYDFTPQATAWQTAIVANGGSMPNATLQIFDNYFFKPMITASLLNEFDRINIYVGTGNEIAARTSLVSSSTYLVTPVSSPIWANSLGYRSAGAGSYLNLNYAPSASGVKYQIRNASMFYIAKDPDYGTVGISDRSGMGGAIAGNQLQRVPTDGGTYNSLIHTTTAVTINFGSILTGSVMHMGSFSASLSGASGLTRQSIYIPGTGLYAQVDSGTLRNPFPSTIASYITQFELNTNANGSPRATGYELVSPHMVSAHGSFRLYQSGSTVYSILQNLFTQLGV